MYATPALRQAKFFIMDLNRTDLRVGAQMRARRIALDVGAEKLARALGVSIQQVIKVIAWELGVTRIGASWLRKIAEILDVNPEYFFKDSDSPRLH
jgi:transcriptional regulator with XRE-family HTH domain